MFMIVSPHKKLLGLVFALFLAVGLILGGTQGAYANVVIKTQAAADNVPNGIRGIDVSKWQGNIDWNKVAGSNVNFAMIRATLGMEVDETFYRNATNAHAAGIKVGAYHYAKFTDYNSMLNEAELFLKQLKQVTITYPVVLDVEATRGLSKKDLARLCALFLEEVKAAGYDVMFYTYENFIDPYLDMSQLSGYHLWIANYLAEPNRNQAMWQHTSYGGVSGINGRVDINIAYKDLSRGGGTIYVDADVSRWVKETLNTRYGVGLPLDSLDMDQMNRALAIGLQAEVNRQFGVDLPIYEEVSDEAIAYLAGITYVPRESKGNIIFLIQSKLFYSGYFEGYQSGEYDEYTEYIIGRYQQRNGLDASGVLDADTIWHLFG